MPAAPQSAPAAVEPTQPPLKVLLPSPIGDLALTLRGAVVTGLKVAAPRSEKARYTPFSKVAGGDFLDEIFGRLSEYLAGARPSPDLEYDLAETGLESFARRVLKETAKIPHGRTRTYRKIATAAGRPDAYRQVLAILMANPIPLLIPCHRVVTNKSGIGSWVAGKERKRWLLAMEREAAKNDGGDEDA
jgi:methylated-DNA-[protein]-cysteine S-methyltransferase